MFKWRVATGMRDRKVADLPQIPGLQPCGGCVEEENEGGEEENEITKPPKPLGDNKEETTKPQPPEVCDGCGL